MAAYTRSQQSLDKLLAASVSLATSRAQLAIRKRDMDGALKEAQRARYEAERTQGIVYDELGEPDQAREHFVNALAAAEALGDASAIAFTCNSLGIVAGRQADGPASRQWLMRAMQGFEDVGNLLQAEIVRSNIAALCITTRDFSGAVAAGESALAFFQAIKHSRLIASTASSVAEAFFELNQLDKATRYAELVLAQEESQFTPYALFTLGEIKHAQSQTAEARAMLEEAMRIAQSNQDQYIEAYVRRKLGQVLLSQGEDIKGQKYLKQARELFQKMGMMQELT